MPRSAREIWNAAFSISRMLASFIQEMRPMNSFATYFLAFSNISTILELLANYSHLMQEAIGSQDQILTRTAIIGISSKLSHGLFATMIIDEWWTTCLANQLLRNCQNSAEEQISSSYFAMSKTGLPILHFIVTCLIQNANRSQYSNHQRRPNLMKSEW